MQQQTLTLKMLRQRKFLLVLPLLALPFTTLLFGALGGGKAVPANAKTSTEKGINPNLPDAKIKDGRALNKMSYYDLAMADSNKLREQIKSDPYYRQQADAPAFRNLTGNLLMPGKLKDSLPIESQTGTRNGSNNRAASEAQVYQKLAALQQAIRRPSTAQGMSNKAYPDYLVNGGDAAGLLQKKLQDQNKQPAEDPEMKQMNGLLEKVLDIQHPERVNDKLRASSAAHLGQVYPVTADLPASPVSILNNDQFYNDTEAGTHRGELKGFYSLDEQGGPDLTNTIPAVIHETQTLVSGSVIKLRLTAPVWISGVLVPKNNFLFGVAALSGERLGIKINSIRYHHSLFPVSLSVYDLDGLEGIEIPGAISRDVAKESTASAIQNIGLASLDPSIGAQAASAGIEAAKTLLSKKVKIVRVSVKAGYQVLLKDEKAKDITP